MKEIFFQDHVIPSFGKWYLLCLYYQHFIREKFKSGFSNSWSSYEKIDEICFQNFLLPMIKVEIASSVANGRVASWFAVPKLNGFTNLIRFFLHQKLKILLWNLNCISKSKTSVSYFFKNQNFSISKLACRILPTPDGSMIASKKIRSGCWQHCFFYRRILASLLRQKDLEKKKRNLKHFSIFSVNSIFLTIFTSYFILLNLKFAPSSNVRLDLTMADVLDLENHEDFEMDDDGDRKYNRICTTK